MLTTGQPNESSITSFFNRSSQMYTKYQWKRKFTLRGCLSYIYILVLSNLYFQYSTKISFGNVFFFSESTGIYEASWCKSKMQHLKFFFKFDVFKLRDMTCSHNYLTVLPLHCGTYQTPLTERLTSQNVGCNTNKGDIALYNLHLKRNPLTNSYCLIRYYMYVWYLCH